MNLLPRLQSLRPLLVLTAALAVIATPLDPGAALAAPEIKNTYYVDCSSTVSGSGTEAAPWNSLASINHHGSFAAGESILLRRGTSCTGQIRPSGSGNSSARIVIGAYGRGQRPSVAGGGTANSSGTIQLSNQSYWTVQDLRVTNRGGAKETTNYRSAVLVTSTSGRRLAGLTIQRLAISRVVSNLTAQGAEPREYGGISVLTPHDARQGSGFEDLRITKNTISGVGRTGIAVSNDAYPASSDLNVRISYNRVIRSRGDSIILRGSRDGRIDHNLSAHGADLWPCKQCGPITPVTANAGIWPATSKRVTIDHNEVYGEHRLGGDGVGLDIDLSAEQAVVEYNYIHDNEGGGLLFCGSKNATARFNILENNQRGAFVFIGSIPAYNSKIYNNTIYSRVGNDAKVVHTQGNKGGKGIRFFNNLIYNMDDSGYYTWPTKPTTRTNTYIGVHGLGEPNDVGKGWTDPGLRNPGSGRVGIKTLGGYKPTSSQNDPIGSPIPKTVTRDFFGVKINWRKPPRGAAV